jgi:hypothetical protein
VETKATHRVDQDVAAVDPLVLRGVGEEGRVLRSEMRQVEAGACDVSDVIDVRDPLPWLWLALTHL